MRRWWMNSREFEGAWWRSDRPNERVGGRLVYSEEGIHLQLIGSLASPEAFFSGDLSTYPLIFGDTTEGKELTLVECVDVGGRLGTGVPTQRLVPRVILVGAHFATGAQQTWGRAFVSFAHLGDWFASNVIDAVPQLDDHGLSGYSVTYTRPDPLEAALPEANVRLDVLVKVDATHGAGRSLQPRATFGIAMKPAQTFEQLMQRYVVPLQDLLTLATGRPCSTTTLNLLTPDLVLGEGGSELPVEALFRSARVGPDDEVEVLHPGQMLFTAQTIASDFEAFVRRWMKLAGEVESVRSLLFGAQYIPGGLENRFLNAVQAAEVLHRLAFKGTDLPKAQHDQRMGAILDVVPGELRAWLRDKLAWSNELTLRQRLDALCDYVQPALDGIVASRDSFVKRVKLSRNDLTHRGRIENRSDEGLRQLFLLASAVEVLVQAALLRRLDFSPESTAECVKRSTSYATVAANGGIH
jgi:hypothetical protein